MNQLPDKPVLNRRFRMQWEEAQQAHVLLYPEGMVRLNQSAAEILKRCNGVATVDEIIVDLQAAFGAEDLRGDVLDLLAHAQEKDWIR